MYGMGPEKGKAKKRPGDLLPGRSWLQVLLLRIMSR
jgi:hypothetical protein